MYKQLSVGGGSWGDALIWEQYGYWHLHSLEHAKKYGTKAFPEWYAKALKEAHKRIKELKEPDLRVKLTLHKNKDYDTFSIYDKANPKIKPFTVNVSKQDAYSKPISTKAYAKKRLNELKHLHEGSVRALLHYQRTGTITRPNWNTNKIDSYGYKEVNGKIQKAYVPRLEEVQKKAVLTA